jgi:hypothetical protein
MIKELKDISWQVSEKQYRNDNAISYSTLSTFARLGIKGLRKLYINPEVLDSAPLRHGSLVDTLLTDKENFYNKYVIYQGIKPPDAVINVLKLIWEKSDKKTKYLDKIAHSLILQSARELSYCNTYKDDTILSRIYEAGYNFFKIIPEMEDGKKELVHFDDFIYARDSVREIYKNKFTSWIFDTSDPEIKLYYQLKFKITYNLNSNIYPLDWKDSLLEDNTIKCMVDMIIVNYRDKTIQPIDLKTTSHNEEDFIVSIQDWYYDLQATKYSYIIREVCKTDVYFKDFKVLPFMFLPINKIDLNPQIYKYNNSIYDKQEDFKDYKGNTHLAWYKYYALVYWHVKNNEFNYNKSTILNNGINEVVF